MFGYSVFGKARFAEAPAYTGITYTLTTANFTFTPYPITATYLFPPVRVTTTMAEVYYNNAGDAVITTVMAEVWQTIAPVKARVTTVMAEVFRTIRLADDCHISLIC